MKLNQTILATTVALAAAAPADAACRWITDQVPLIETATQPGLTVFDVDLAQAVSLEHVSLAYLDSITFTKAGGGTSTLSCQLLSNGMPVSETLDLLWAAGSMTPRSISTHNGWVLDGSPGSVDGLRFMVEQSSAGMTTTLRGVHEGDTLKVGFFVAPFVPEGPHDVVGLGFWPTTTVEGGDTTEWNPIPIAPMPAADLRVVGGTGPGACTLSETGTSASIESQLMFDNGITLTCDDWSAPSLGQAPPPEENWHSSRSFLEITDDMAQLIEGANLVGFRWRIHCAGAGSATFTFDGERTLGVLFDVAAVPADVNVDGIVDVQDLVAVIVAWGTDDPHADVNGDGTVDVSDLVEVIVNWGPCE